MRKSLLTFSLTLMLGAAGAAVAVAATTPANTAEAGKPLQLAQVLPQPLDRPGNRSDNRPGPQGRGMDRAPLSAEALATRHKALCEDRHDRMAGQLAYLEARLDLNATQRTAFARWRDVRLAAARRQADACAAQPTPAGRGAAATPPSPVERMAREEQQLRSRLADITAQRPALEALYNSLSPEQRQKFTPAGLDMRGPRGMGRGGMRPRIAMMMRDRMGPRGGGPDGPGGFGRGPGGPGRGMGRGPGTPPPPAQ